MNLQYRARTNTKKEYVCNIIKPKDFQLTREQIINITCSTNSSPDNYRDESDFWNVIKFFLTPQQYQVVTLYFIDGCTYKEIGALYSITSTRVRLIIYRALQILRKIKNRKKIQIFA